MKNKIAALALLFALVLNTVVAQTSKTSSKQLFDELWDKASNSKTGDVTKDLNAIEKDKIKSIDVKEKNTTNPNYNYKNRHFRFV